MESKTYIEVAQESGAASSLVYVLKMKGLINWQSVIPSKHPTKGYDTSLIPVITWGINSECIDRESEVANLINEFNGVIDWHARKLKSGRWRLMPQEAWQVLDSNRGFLPTDATCLVEQDDPYLAPAANKELLALAEYLEERL